MLQSKTRAVRQNAAAIIAAHNHSSLDPTLSSEDVAVTTEILESGKLLAVGVLGHLVLGGALARLSS